MELVKLTCTENNRTLDASVLKRSDRFLEVVVEGTDTKVTLAKKSPDERVYVGHMAGLEFISTGGGLIRPKFRGSSIRSPSASVVRQFSCNQSTCTTVETVTGMKQKRTILVDLKAELQQFYR